MSPNFDNKNRKNRNNDYSGNSMLNSKRSNNIKKSNNK